MAQNRVTSWDTDALSLTRNSISLPSEALASEMVMRALSSLVILPFPWPSVILTPASSVPDRFTLKLSTGSTTASSTVITVTVVVAPGAEFGPKDTVPPDTVV